jgi:hypothetical protein
MKESSAMAWDINDAAVFLKVTPRYIRTLLKRGMPHCKFSYRVLRFDPEAVRIWFASRQNAGKASS